MWNDLDRRIDFQRRTSLAFRIQLSARLANLLPRQRLSTTRRAPLPDPIEVGVVWRGDVSRDELAADKWRFCAWIQPFLDFSVAISKGKSARAVVIAGGVIDNRGGRHRVDHVDAEVTVVDAVLAFIEEDKGARRAGVEDFGHFFRIIEFAHGCDEIVGAVNPAIHRDAADAIVSGGAFDRAALVSWAFVDAYRFVIRPEFSVWRHEIQDIGVGDVVGLGGEPSGTPTFACADDVVRRQLIIRIARIQVPRQMQLLRVVHATDALPLGLGFVEGRQQHRCKNRDDRNDH